MPGGPKIGGPGAAETTRTLILNRKGLTMTPTIGELRSVATGGAGLLSAVLLDLEGRSPHTVFIDVDHGFEQRT